MGWERWREREPEGGRIGRLAAESLFTPSDGMAESLSTAAKVTGEKARGTLGGCLCGGGRGRRRGRAGQGAGNGGGGAGGAAASLFSSSNEMADSLTTAANVSGEKG